VCSGVTDKFHKENQTLQVHLSLEPALQTVISCGHSACTVWVGLLNGSVAVVVVLSMCTTNSQSPESLSDISGEQVLFDLGCDTLVGGPRCRLEEHISLGDGSLHRRVGPEALQSSPKASRRIQAGLLCMVLWRCLQPMSKFPFPLRF
jgi:hypothetical protein